MKRKRLLGFILSGLMLFSSSLAYIPENKVATDLEMTANAAVENFNYSDANVFVADSLLGQAVLPNGENYIGVNPALAYDISAREWTFKEIAEGLIEKEWLAGLDIFWINMEKTLSFEFVGDESVFTWEQAFYETLIMDYLTYCYESDEFESELAQNTMSFAVDLMKEFEGSDYFQNLKKASGQNSSGKAAINTVSLDKAATHSKQSNLINGCDLFSNTLDTVDNLMEGVETVSDYYEKIAKLMALQQADEERIAFLEQIKAGSNDENLNRAVDDIIEKYHASMAELSLNELSEIGLEKLNGMVWDKIVEFSEIPVLSEVQLGVSGFDLFFNNNGIAESRMQLTILYIIHSHVRETYQNLREKYNANKTPENAKNFINAYQQYAAFVAYASNVTKNYLGQRFVEGWANQLTNWIVPDNDGKVTYDGFNSAMDSCITSCTSLNQFPSTAYKMYNVLSGNSEYIGNPEVTVTGIVFEQHEITIDLERYKSYPIGMETLVKTVITPNNATNQNVSFSSSNADIVKVDSSSCYPNLYLIPVGVGTAEVTVIAEDGGYTDSVKVTVIDSNNPEDNTSETDDNQPIEDNPPVEDTPETNASNFEYQELNDGTIEITKYIGTDNKVIIPKKIENKLVTSIGDSAFYDCNKLTTVTIPDSVTNIGKWAFINCHNLISVTIPESVIDIGDKAFSSCSDLTAIEVSKDNSKYASEDGVLFNKDKTTLIKYPVGNTRTEYVIPNSVINIENEAIVQCGNLISIKVSKNNSNYVSENGVLFNKDKTTLIQYPIGNTRTEYVIPNSVTNIEKWAFGGCDNLFSVTIPNSVTSIGGWAFFSMNLTTINIPDSVTIIGSQAFSYCQNLTSVIIPKSVTNIEYLAFSGCSSLTSVMIPESVMSIEYGVFENCKKLTSITIKNPICKFNDYSNRGFISNTTTIYGYENSTAQDMAEKYNYNFKSLGKVPTYEKGNIRCNGSIGVADAVYLQKYLHGKQKLTQEQAKLADMNDDGIVNVYDLILLKRKLIYG